MKRLLECAVGTGLGLISVWFCITHLPLLWQIAALAGCCFLFAFLTYHVVKGGC